LFDHPRRQALFLIGNWHACSLFTMVYLERASLGLLLHGRGVGT
jgi:hypothetical protein